MMHSLTPVDCLPSAMIGQILHQLNLITGSRGIIIAKDQIITMRYAAHFACTSKSLNNKVNDLAAVHVFLHSMAEKYHTSPAQCAALFNTLGARRWLLKHVLSRGLDRTFQIIHDIYQVAVDILDEAKGLDNRYENIRLSRECPSPNLYNYRTPKEVLLYTAGGSHALATPFGQIHIRYEGATNRKIQSTLSQVLLTRLGATLKSLRTADSASLHLSWRK